MVFVLAFLHLMLLVATLAVSIMGLTALAVIDGMVQFQSFETYV